MNPNLALNIYTAVSNPITNDGREKITRGCLKNKDLRGYLHPDILPNQSTQNNNNNSEDNNEDNSEDSDNDSDDSILRPVKIPVIILQSTENLLVNASNVDSFLIGRQTKHLWSHQQNILTNDKLMSASDSSAQWVGKLSNNSSDYRKFSLLDKQGLNMLLDNLNNPRGAFVIWTRTGHALYQENKTALLDLIDALAYPSPEYYGLNVKGKDKLNLTNVIEVEPPKTTKKKKKIIIDDENDNDDQSEIDNININKDNDENDDEMVLFKIKSPPKMKQIEIEIEEKEEEKLLKSPSSIELKSLTSKEPIEIVEYFTLPEQNQLNTTFDDESKIKIISQNSEEIKKSDIIKNPVKSLITSDDLKKSKPIVMKPTISPPKLPQKSSHFGELINQKIDSSILPNQTPITTIETITIETKTETPTIISTSKSNLQEILDTKLKKQQEKDENLTMKKKEDDLQRLERLSKEQEARKKQYKDEDDELLKKLEKELEERRKERENSERLRRLEIQQIEDKLINSGLIPEYIPSEGESIRIRELPDMKYDTPAELPSVFTESRDTVTSLDRMLLDEENAKKEVLCQWKNMKRLKHKCY